ncbi:type VII secretion protein EccB [Streptomyces fumanus]|uniref:Type VII secretion protein EccB n=1 Tax=Streptomyces fumanus TaxID=67302 RepID=A0A919AUH4_9ACTN|nr:type VII secretion protein EccB [Streptomyces fumanus]GHF23820.1 type VII secretion protein EccB [Streptomyces fumanus]
MQNRRDQVQAHRFVVTRLTSGLLRADPDIPEPPTRRTDRAVLVGTVFSIVLCVGFLVYGLISPGGATGWRDGRTLVVDKGTGTRYLFDGERLRPVRNYASARLLVGEGLVTDTVASASLRGTPHGDPVGIPGAPDDLPDAGGPTAWQVCAGTVPADSSGRRGRTTLVVDSRLRGGTLPGKGVLVGAEDGTLYLVTDGRRHRLPQGRTAATALGFGSVTPLPVSAAFLDAVPAGADLAPPSVTGLGGAGPDLDGTATRTGQVFVTRAPGSAQQYYLLLRSGLVPVTTTQAALALAAPATREKAYGGKVPQALALSSGAPDQALSPRDAGGEAAAAEREGAALPRTPPGPLSLADDTDLCVRLAPRGERGTAVSLETVAATEVAAGASAPGEATAAPCLAVDAIAVPVSGGGLVRALSSTGTVLGDTTYVVADTGRKYRVASEEAATALGYDLADARKLPAALLDMLPTGPDLSPEAATAGEAAVAGAARCGSRPGAGTDDS